MRLSFAVCFGTVLIFSVVALMTFAELSLAEANLQSSYPTKTYGSKVMVCSSHVSEAFETLEKKIDNLIALVSKLCTPPPPGK